MKQVIAGGTLVWSHRAPHAGDDADVSALAAEFRQAHSLQADNTPTLIPAEGRKEV